MFSFETFSADVLCQFLLTQEPGFCGFPNATHFRRVVWPARFCGAAVRRRVYRRPAGQVCFLSVHDVQLRQGATRRHAWYVSHLHSPPGLCCKLSPKPSNNYSVRLWHIRRLARRESLWPLCSATLRFSATLLIFHGRHHSGRRPLAICHQPRVCCSESDG